MKVGSLFSGIGGIELGFEREGFETRWFVEKDPFCQAVLKKHWPKVPVYGDITKTDFTKLEKVEVLTGGFPCQDISVAGKGAGVEGGACSGLWREYFRAIREIRPKYAVIENVSAITFRGLDIVLANLAEAGYDAEWFDLRASDFGALHKRERIFIIAYCDAFSRGKEGNKQYDADFVAKDWGERIQGFREEAFQRKQGFSWCENVGSVKELKDRPDIPEPLIRGKSNGFSTRLDRTRAIGNAVVPQVAQFIARQIKEVAT